MFTASSLEFLSFDRVAPQYDASRHIPETIMRNAAHLIIQTANLNAHTPMVDAGTGTGRFAVPLVKFGIPVLGIDISHSMLLQAKLKVNPLKYDRSLFTQSDLRRLPIQSQSCHAALLVHVLHLIVDWKAVLLEIKRILRPGAVLIIATESGKRFPTREIYFELARERNMLRHHIGLTDLNEAIPFLKSLEAEITELDNRNMEWTAESSIKDTLQMLGSRLFSQTWAIPENVHQEMMMLTSEWAANRYGSFDIIEKMPAQIMMWCAKFPD